MIFSLRQTFSKAAFACHVRRRKQSVGSRSVRSSGWHCRRRRRCRRVSSWSSRRPRAAEGSVVSCLVQKTTLFCQLSQMHSSSLLVGCIFSGPRRDDWLLRPLLLRLPAARRRQRSRRPHRPAASLLQLRRPAASPCAHVGTQARALTASLDRCLGQISCEEAHHRRR